MAGLEVLNMVTIDNEVVFFQNNQSGLDIRRGITNLIKK
jgi:hypothetical protein